MPALHVPGGANYVSSIAVGDGHHVVDDFGRIAQIGHGYHYEFARSVLKSCLYRVQRPSPVLVANKAKGKSRLALEFVGGRKGRVIVPVIDKPHFRVHVYLGIKLRQGRTDVLSLVVDGDCNDDTCAQMPPIRICSTIQGITSSSIWSSVVSARKPSNLAAFSTAGTRFCTSYLNGSSLV